MKYHPAIGLEIHVELDTKSKMFCSCKNDPEEKKPNTNVCPICLGHPGTLPVINKKAIKKVIKTGLALNCEISKSFWFDRKNYFYPDLPKGYQISQHHTPICKSGFLKISDKKIRVREIHLEEDTCKLYHKKDFSLVDCNRSGVPLMELVTEPDLASGQEAKKFSQEFILILRRLGISNADMEKGQMRIEANVSVSKDPKKLGTRTELKNINSFKSVQKAVDFEIERQKKVLEKGEKILQQTRGWDETKQETVLQREKETAFDYRYFPEPDLPPLEIDNQFLEEIKTELKELPQEKRKRLKREYELSEKEVEFLIKNQELSSFFEKVISELPSGLDPKDLKELIKLTLNYIKTDLTGLLKETKTKTKDLKISPENFAEFINLISKEEISSKVAKEILPEMFGTGIDPSQIIEKRGLLQVTDKSEIEEIVRKVISENPKPVSDYKSGKEQALQFLIGKVMQVSFGKTKPEMAKEILKNLLS